MPKGAKSSGKTSSQTLSSGPMLAFLANASATLLPLRFTWQKLQDKNWEAQ